MNSNFPFRQKKKNGEEVPGTSGLWCNFLLVFSCAPKFWNVVFLTDILDLISLLEMQMQMCFLLWTFSLGATTTGEKRHQTVRLFAFSPPSLFASPKEKGQKLRERSSCWNQKDSCDNGYHWKLWYANPFTQIIFITNMRYELLSHYWWQTVPWSREGGSYNQVNSRAGFLPRTSLTQSYHSGYEWGSHVFEFWTLVRF